MKNKRKELKRKRKRAKINKDYKTNGASGKNN